MPKYLLETCYTSEGAKGLMKDGGTKRRQAAERAITSVGAKLEAFYFAFGDADAILIVDAADNATISAASIAVNASGAVTSKTRVLMTPDEVDQAVKKTVSYTPPGH